MKDTSTQIIEILQNRGYRTSAAREQICKIFVMTKRPLSIQELVEQTTVDEASVYRIVHLLRREDLIEEISIKDEKPRYALATHHHHHAICEGCGFVTHMPCHDVSSIPKAVTGFAKITGHEVTFYGRCRDCN